jgi:hypothetical protein
MPWKLSISVTSTRGRSPPRDWLDSLKGRVEVKRLAAGEPGPSRRSTYPGDAFGIIGNPYVQLGRPLLIAGAGEPLMPQGQRSLPNSARIGGNMGPIDEGAGQV